MTLPILDFIVALGLMIVAIFFVEGNAGYFCSLAGGFFGWGAAQPMVFGGHILEYPR